jgi:hypothetical protein
MFCGDDLMAVQRATKCCRVFESGRNVAHVDDRSSQPRTLVNGANAAGVEEMMFEPRKRRLGGRRFDSNNGSGNCCS